MTKASKALLFDLGHVIVELDQNRTKKALSDLLDIPYDGHHERVDEIFLKFETGKISKELFINYLIEFGDHTVQALDIIQAWNAMLIGVKKETVDLLRFFKKNYHCWVYSNTNALHMQSMTDYFEKAHDITDWKTDLFHQVYLSYELGFRKPDSQGFEMILAENKIDSKEVVFIDDHLPNLEAASALGFQVIHKKPEDNFVEVMHSFR